MKGREFKRVWGFAWDCAFLLQIEQRKLKEMAAYFKKHKRTVGWKRQVRDCELCVKLIDIILERDPYQMSWLHANYGNEGLYNTNIEKFPKYINLRNYRRFMPTLELEKVNPKMIEHLKISLRQQKAMYLYNKIRAYRMFHWWN